MHGFLNVDKAEDWTSHDVVAKLRRALKPFGVTKIGHTGTLDPFATGVLPIAIGASTRLIRFLPKTKRYMAEIDFSCLTDTDDITGELLEENAEQLWTRESLEIKLRSLLGKIEQLPPLYSARKHKGKRLYDLMRSETEFEVDEIKTKEVEILGLNLLDFNYPLAVIDVNCSEGTYIRSIARDLGGHLSKLRRLESNKFKIDKSLTLDQLLASIDDIENFLIPSAKALDLPVLELDNKEIIFLQQGREISLGKRAETLCGELNIPKNAVSVSGDSDDNNTYIKCLDEHADLVALACVEKLRGDLVLRPKIVL